MLKKLYPILSNIKARLLSVLLLFLAPTGFAMTTADIIKNISTCPKSPNCISTLSPSAEHKTQAWPMPASKQESQDRIKSLILKLPRTQLIAEGQDYFHFVFTSLIFRFKDDVLFYFDDQKKEIHFKSSSRTGHSDLGANLKRMKNIKRLLDKL